MGGRMSEKFRQKVWQFLVREDGPTVVEYAILLALLVGMMMAAIMYVGEQAQGVSNDVVTGMDNALNTHRSLP